MNIKYIIAVDFEATFDNKSNNNPHEIIEFPAILMDLTTNSKVSHFHEYVKPTGNAILSEKCINHTGIQQRSINEARNLQEVLQAFDIWLKRVISQYGLVLPNIPSANQINCVFVTWGDYDFKQFLIPECSRKGYNVQSYFKTWVDLRLTYNSLHGGGLISLNDALKKTCVPVEGRLHSGIGDAKNLANLARKLYITGGRMTTLSKY